MNKISYSKLILTILVSLVSLVYAAPNFFRIEEGSFLPSKSVNLGLDLRGGSHLLLKVDIQKYVEDQLEILSDVIRKDFRHKKLGYRGIRVRDGAVILSMRNKEDLGVAKQLVNLIDGETTSEVTNEEIIIRFNQSKLSNLHKNLFDQSIEIIRMRVDSAGTKEPVIQKQGDQYIILQVPGEDNPQHIKKILGQTAKLSFHNVLEDAGAGSDTISLPFKDDKDGLKIPLAKRPILTGDMLINASSTFSDNSEPAVVFSLNNVGAKLFSEATKNARGKRIAIVLDGKVLSAPSINEPIPGGKGVISGSFTVDSAEDLALMLRAGALPAPLLIVEERVIGATLGSDSIEDGKKAGVIGFAGVVIFMIWSYGMLGVLANIALLFSMLYILSILSALQATLTLPGIAGIILTIGMAVDANVLIYERIREEAQKNVSIAYAVSKGFDAAFATIADSNITTLISAILLYIFGTGPIKGFAVSLSIGIIASMFSAIVITKLLIDLWIKLAKPKTLGI
ncbi:MAG: protein translocase subunit SecD [Rickettsiaceae bacterium]|nr:protein translocase subunit SecD [Rickettsiaceae bacterium]